jgi:Leishmanolysin
MMLLLSVIFTIFGTIGVEEPDEVDLKFCREQATFVPWRIAIWNVPDKFPKHYESAMYELLSYLMQSVKVRDAENESPNLMIKLTINNTIAPLASSVSLMRDSCGRPKIAKITWSKKYFKRTREQFITIFLHELMHVMGGFNSDDAPFYFLFGKTVNTKEDQGLINGHIKQVGKHFYVVSPGVLKEVHKVNPSLIGAPLQCERIKGNSCPGSHWHGKKFLRKIGPDGMLPYSGYDGLSKITVAMINDFGWYEIDYDRLSKLLEPTLKVLNRRKKTLLEKILPFIIRYLLLSSINLTYLSIMRICCFLT